jgi:hypothetical protein
MHRRVSYAPALSLFLVVLWQTSCCDDGGLRLQPHWLNTTEGYWLKLSSIDLSGGMPIRITETTDQRGDGFADSYVAGFITPRYYRFGIQLENRTAGSLSILWPQARYIDEKGQEHTVYRQPMGVLPDLRDDVTASAPVKLRPGGKIHDIIVPIYKQRMLSSGCRELTPWSEPLIPTNLQQMNEEETKTYVKDLARTQTPIKLAIPVRVGDETRTYTFSFVLKDQLEELRRMEELRNESPNESPSAGVQRDEERGDCTDCDPE